MKKLFVPKKIRARLRSSLTVTTLLALTALRIQLLRPVFKKENAAPEETNMPPLDLRPLRMRQAK
jgi:hypothetical protein